MMFITSLAVKYSSTAAVPRNNHGVATVLRAAAGRQQLQLQLQSHSSILGNHKGPQQQQQRRTLSASAKVWIDKDTRVICQGFTGKQVSVRTEIATREKDGTPQIDRQTDRETDSMQQRPS